MAHFILILEGILICTALASVNPSTMKNDDDFEARDNDLVTNEDPCCRRLEEDGRRYTFDCSDCSTFPLIPQTVVSVTIEGGDFDLIEADAVYLTPFLKEISISNCAIERIASSAFNNILAVNTIEFHNVNIGRIDKDAFHMIYFDDDDNIVPRFVFDNVSIESSVLPTTEIVVPSGLILIRDVTVTDGVFPHLFLVEGGASVDIVRHSQQVLRSSIVHEDALVNKMSNSRFYGINENLQTIDEDVTIDWSEIYVPCHDEDIQWLLDDPDSIKEDILNSLICEEPPDLKGQFVRDLAHGNSVAVSSCLSFVVLIINLIGSIVV